MPFYTSIAKYYDHIFPLENSIVNFIKSKASRKNEIFMDIGSATGTLSIAMSDLSKYVIGIDMDKELVSLANEKISRKDNVRCISGNMLDIKKHVEKGHKVSTISCIGNTLVHLCDTKDMNSFIRSSFELLEKDGRLIIQIINYDRIMKYNISSLKTIENDKIVFYRDYETVHDSRLLDFNTRLVIKDEGKHVIENSVKLYPLLKNELHDMIMEAGFLKTVFFGSYDMEEYAHDSFLTIAVSEK